MQKNNLFILHTHYNLIMACSVIHDFFSADKNDLILHAEFNVSPQLEKTLQDTFDCILFLQNAFVKKEKIIDQEVNLYKKYKKFKGFKKISKQKYNQVLLSQEDFIDTLIARDIASNAAIKCSYIEDGVDAYFSVNAALNTFDKASFALQNQTSLKNRSPFKKGLSRLKKMLYGKNNFFEAKYCYGMNSMYSASYVIFPEEVRNEIQHTEIKEIRKQSLLKGLTQLYNYLPPLHTTKNQVVVLFFDLISRIPEGVDFASFFNGILAWAKNEGIQVMYKYHPRETDAYATLEQSDVCTALEKNIPSEKILADLEGKQVTVIGNLSTSLIVAKKIGFSAICIAVILGIENTAAFDFFKKIGIAVPANFQQLLSQIEKESV